MKNSVSKLLMLVLIGSTASAMQHGKIDALNVQSFFATHDVEADFKEAFGGQIRETLKAITDSLWCMDEIKAIQQNYADPTPKI